MTDLRTVGSLDRIKGRILSIWDDVTDDDVDNAEGNIERLVGTIKEKTGEDVESIRRTIGELLGANGDDGDGDDGDEENRWRH